MARRPAGRWLGVAGESVLAEEPVDEGWSSGPVEGRDGHIKMIKRQMSGRAGLPLLRKRVLLTARS